nr:MAG TPA: Histone deacetylation protein Rxt3 [Caudoviricetes sp.]
MIKRYSRRTAVGGCIMYSDYCSIFRALSHSGIITSSSCDR